MAEDLPPASDDDAVQQFLDTYWRVALAGTREALEALRKVLPELSAHLPETGRMHLGSALRELENALVEIHKSGRYLIGTDEYQQVLEEQTRRQLGS